MLLVAQPSNETCSIHPSQLDTNPSCNLLILFLTLIVLCICHRWVLPLAPSPNAIGGSYPDSNSILNQYRRHTPCNLSGTQLYRESEPYSLILSHLIFRQNIVFWVYSEHIEIPIIWKMQAASNPRLPRGEIMHSAPVKYSTFYIVIKRLVPQEIVFPSNQSSRFRLANSDLSLLLRMCVWPIG